jgi:large subunit ribosomal protein L25
MAEQIVLNAEPRTDMGTGASRRLRRNSEKVPGVIYGGGEDALPLTLEYRVLAKAMQQESFFSQILNVSIDGKAQQAVLRDLQRHPANEKVLHVDFLRIRADKPIQISVPLHFLNEDKCYGVTMEEGNISRNLIEVEISCLPADLPEHLELDIEHLRVGQSVHLSDLELPEGVTIVALSYGEERDIPIVSIQVPRGGHEDEADTEGVETTDEEEPTDAESDDRE